MKRTLLTIIISISILLVFEVKMLNGLLQGPKSIITSPTQGTWVLSAQGVNTIQSSIVAGNISGSSTPYETPMPQTNIQSEIPISNGSMAPSAALPNLVTQDLTLTESLTVLGDTMFGKTTIAGGLVVDGTVALNKRGIESMGDTLYIEQQKLAAINIMGGTMIVGTDGNINVNGNLNVLGTLGVSTVIPASTDITVDLSHAASGSSGFSNLILKGPQGTVGIFDASGSARFGGNIEASGTGRFSRLYAPIIETTKLMVNSESPDTSSVGQARIPAGLTRMKVLTNAINKDSRVFVTPVSVTSKAISVTEVNTPDGNNEGSFTIEIASPDTNDVDFNWFIVN